MVKWLGMDDDTLFVLPSKDSKSSESTITFNGFDLVMVVIGLTSKSISTFLSVANVATDTGIDDKKVNPGGVYPMQRCLYNPLYTSPKIGQELDNTVFNWLQAFKNSLRFQHLHFLGKRLSCLCRKMNASH